MRYTTNQDIRDYMADHSVTQQMLAEHLGKSKPTITKMLKTELAQKEKDDLLNHIDAIASENKGKVQEEPEVEDLPEEDECPPTVDTTCGTKFQLGDRVKIPSKQLVIGTVSDIWSSLAQNKVMYAVRTEDGRNGLYAEDQLEPAPIPIEYTFNATVENNVAVVCMIAHQGEKTWVYARGHAHILHDGAVGEAQAVSYAAKRMFESLDTKNDNPIYFKDGGNK
jgi:predicted XRE-type DNA-binding protein